MTVDTLAADAAPATAPAPALATATATAPALAPDAAPAAASPTRFADWPIESLMDVARRPPQVFVRGQGSWLWDSEGRRHLDWVQGWAVNTLGHAPAAIAEAIARQAGTLLQAGPGFYNDQAVALAAQLAALSGLERVFVTTSGAEANEGAVKLARKHGRVRRGGADRIVSFQHGFHGRTLAMMAASGKPGFDSIYTPAVPGFVHLPYNDLAAVQALLHGPDGARVAGVMLELVQGEAGVVAAEPAFVQGLRALCDAHGALLIVDEVQTGVGRCGPLFVHQAFGIRPDVMTLGKGLGGGVPVGAVLAREDVCCFAPGDQGGTYNGNPLVCAAARAVLAAVTADGFLAGVQRRGDQLARGLTGLAARHGLGAVHGHGLLRALDLPPSMDAGALADAAREPGAGDGLLVNPVRPQRLRLMPALNTTADEIAHGLALLDAALARAAASAR